jgi:hypothetical protein
MKSFLLILQVSFIIIACNTPPSSQHIINNDKKEMKISDTSDGWVAILNCQPDPGKYLLIRLTKTFEPFLNKKVLEAHVNQKDIDRLSEPLRALCAYYSAYSGSDCDREGKCTLTTALGLGKQGSDEHKKVLLKWFPTDSNVQRMIDNNCFVGISGANFFCEYNYLRFEQRKDTVIINYRINCWDRGSGPQYKGYDAVILKDDQILFLKRKERKIQGKS